MTPAGPSLRVARTIRADRETLFRAWTDAGELRHWWRQDSDGWAFAEASIDLRVGGSYRLGMTAPDGRRHVAVGRYQEVRPPDRLVFTWDWEDQASRVAAEPVTPRAAHPAEVIPDRPRRNGTGPDSARAASPEYLIRRKPGRRGSPRRRGSNAGHASALSGSANEMVTYLPDPAFAEKWRARVHAIRTILEDELTGTPDDLGAGYADAADFIDDILKASANPRHIVELLSGGKPLPADSPVRRTADRLVRWRGQRPLG